MNSPAWPTHAAHATQHACERATTHGAAHVRPAHDGESRALALLQKHPRAILFYLDDYVHYFYRHHLCKKALILTHLRIGKVPDTSTLASAALTGIGPLCRPIGDSLDPSRGPMLTYGPMCNNGQQFGDQRRSRATFPRRRQPTVATIMFR